MKLHWVELKNWRQHIKTRINFDDETTVIYGTNEQGKTTIFEALSRGLFDKSSSHAEVIKRIKPKTASGDITSTVRIEFTLNKIRYCVEKNFNLKRGTFLHKVVGEESILLAQDNSADEQLIQMLEAQFPSTRGSTPSQWGAFHWLWAPQEGRELPIEKDGDPTAPLHLEPKDGVGVLVTPKFQVVQNSVLASYSQYFTGTGRNSRDSPILKIEEEIQTLNPKKAELNHEIKNVADEKQQLEELERQLPINEKRIIETKKELEEARNESSDFTLIASELKASESSVKEKERDIRDAKKALDELKESAEKIRDIQKKEKQARESLSRIEAICEQMGKRHLKIKENVEEKAMKIRECEELARDARILWTQSDIMQKIKDMEKKIGRIKGIEKKIGSLGKKGVLKLPADTELETLILEQARTTALRESLTEKGLAINITPGEKGCLEVEVDGEKIKKLKEAITGTESVNVSAPGWGEVSVKAKLEQARDAKGDIKRLEESIQRTLRIYNANSIEELKKLNREQNIISKEIQELNAERRGVDGRLLNELTLEVTRLKEKYEENNKIKRTTNSIKLNPTNVNLEKLMIKREKEEEKARGVLDIARTERDKYDEELMEKSEELVELRSVQKHLSEEVENSRNQEREIIRRYGTQEHQEELLVSAKEDLKKRNEEYEKIKHRYEQLEKGPEYRIKRLEQKIESQEQIVRQQQSSIDQLKGGIAVASLGGEYSELAEIESRIEILSERLEKEQIRAKSYALLKESLEQQYRSALSTLVGPIQEDVRHSLSYATGFLHEDVELNEYLFPIRLGERGFEGISLEFNDASSGLKELLTVCVRLAVAEHLSKRDSQCLVLDDPFIHVSSDRSNKMIELINEAIKEYGLQVIVFTHRQMEFSGFTGEVIDIQSVK